MKYLNIIFKALLSFLGLAKGKEKQREKTLAVKKESSPILKPHQPAAAEMVKQRFDLGPKKMPYVRMPELCLVPASRLSKEERKEASKALNWYMRARNRGKVFTPYF